MAQAIAANTANLQSQFNLVRDNDTWSLCLLELARQKNDEQVLAQALLTRGNALGRVATLPDEDRAARLRESLAAYDEALRFRRPDTAPLDYAMTQNNRGTILSDLANLPDEDRAARLRESLAAYDEALRFRRPDTAPLAYAMTQGNLANLSMSFAELPGEDQRARWREAIQHVLTALSLFIQAQHAPYAQQAAGQLRWISERCGDTFPELWRELNIGEMPEWLQKQ
jgi:tetratricopeptide (TPR) repeat protein